ERQLVRLPDAMSDDEVLERLRHRRADPLTRIDMRTLPTPKLYGVVGASGVAAGESALGFSLPPFLKRAHAGAGNGGFGRGGGLLGLGGGYEDFDGKTLIEKYSFLRFQSWPEKLLPLWDWGDGALSCLDASVAQGGIVTSDESGFTLTTFLLEP